MKSRLWGVFQDLFKKLSDTFGLGGESPISLAFGGKSSVEIDLVKASQTMRVGQYMGIANQRIYPPRFGSYVACVQYGFGTVANEKHYSPNAVISV